MPIFDSAWPAFIGLLLPEIERDSGHCSLTQIAWRLASVAPEGFGECARRVIAERSGDLCDRLLSAVKSL
jgi:hypothetical protein